MCRLRVFCLVLLRMGRRRHADTNDMMAPNVEKRLHAVVTVFKWLRTIIFFNTESECSKSKWKMKIKREKHEKRDKFVLTKLKNWNGTIFDGLNGNESQCRHCEQIDDNNFNCRREHSLKNLLVDDVRMLFSLLSMPIGTYVCQTPAQTFWAFFSLLVDTIRQFSKWLFYTFTRSHTRPR